MASVKIEYQEVRNTAESLKESSAKMRGMFDDFDTSMKTMANEDVFVGQASDALKQKFNALKPKFEDYVQLVNEFAGMMIMAADKSEESERTIENVTDQING